MRRIAHLRLVLTGSTRGCICWVERRIKMCRTHHIWIVNNPLYYPSTAVCSAPCQLNESGTDCSPSGKITHPLLKAWQILERVLVQFKWCTHAHVNPGCITLLYRRSLSQSKRRAEMYIWKVTVTGQTAFKRKSRKCRLKGKENNEFFDSGDVMRIFMHMKKVLFTRIPSGEVIYTRCCPFTSQGSSVWSNLPQWKVFHYITRDDRYQRKQAEAQPWTKTGSSTRQQTHRALQVFPGR